MLYVTYALYDGQNILTWHSAVPYTDDDIAEGTIPDTFLPEAREMHGAAVMGNDSVVITGGRSTAAILDDVWILRPVIEDTVNWR